MEIELNGVEIIHRKDGFPRISVDVNLLEDQIFYTRDKGGNIRSVRLERVAIEVPTGDISFWVRPDPAELPDDNNRVVAISGDKFLTLELYDSEEALCQLTQSKSAEKKSGAAATESRTKAE